MVLPQNMMVEFVAKVDLSNLIKFLRLRNHPHAQWEIQEYARAIEKLIEPIVPETMKLYRETIPATVGPVQERKIVPLNEEEFNPTFDGDGSE